MYWGQSERWFYGIKETVLFFAQRSYRGAGGGGKHCIDDRGLRPLYRALYRQVATPPPLSASLSHS